MGHSYSGYLVSHGALHYLASIRDPLASITHLLGAAVFAWMTLLLVRRGKCGDDRGRTTRVFCLLVFGVAAVVLLLASSLFHMPPLHCPARETLRRIDHAAIFALIAATFTPAHGILYRGAGRWFPLCMIWGACLLGIVWKLAFFDQISAGQGIMIYLSLGWTGAITGFALGRRFGMRAVEPLWWGALAYTGGAIVQYLQWPVLWPGVLGAHELFHLAVLAGLGCHWHFVYQMADGSVPAFPPEPESAEAEVVADGELAVTP